MDIILAGCRVSLNEDSLIIYVNGRKTWSKKIIDIDGAAPTPDGKQICVILKDGTCVHYSAETGHKENENEKDSGIKEINNSAQ